MRIHPSKADGRLSKYRSAEIEMRGQNSCCWREVVALLSFREDIRNIVALIAPGVHVNRSKENSKRRMYNNAELGYRLRETKARCEVVGVCVFKTLWETVLASYKDRGNSIGIERQVGIGVTHVHQPVQ